MKKFNLPKFSISFEKLLSIIAIFTSAITVYFISNQTQILQKQFDLTQKQIQLSSLPYLEYGYSNPDSDSFEIFIVNNGLGPAFIEGTSTTYKGIKYAKDLSEVFSTEVFKKDSLNFLYSGMYVGMLIPANKKINLISVKNDIKSLKTIMSLWENSSITNEIVY